MEDDTKTLLIACWYTDGEDDDAGEKKCEGGRLMAVKNGRIHEFFDGQIGKIPLYLPLKNQT